MSANENLRPLKPEDIEFWLTKRNGFLSVQCHDIRLQIQDPNRLVFTKTLQGGELEAQPVVTWISGWLKMMSVMGIGNMTGDEIDKAIRRDGTE
jgi:hypothetical protein